MIRSEVAEIAKEQMEVILNLFAYKNKAYGSSDDVFYNFRQTARRIYNSDDPEHMLKALLTFKDKHDCAVANVGFNDPEFESRMQDIMVYSILALAMYRDAKTNGQL